MMVIGIYDHTYVPGEFGHPGDLAPVLVKALKDCSLDDCSVEVVPLGKEEEKIAVTNLSGFDIVFGHFSSQDNWLSLAEVSSEGTVRIRVSTAGAQPISKDGSRLPWVTKSGAICFSLKHALGKSSISLRDWQDIVNEIRQMQLVDEIRHGKYSIIIGRHFYTDQYIQLLAALSILCQGYLAVYASPTGKPEGVALTEQRIVANALEKMGWMKLMVSKEEMKMLPSVLQSDDEGVRSPLRDNVRNGSSDYWTCIWSDTLDKDAEKEWRAISSSTGEEKSQGFNKVNSLIQQIRNKSDISPDVVAMAYLELAKKLGSANAS